MEESLAHPARMLPSIARYLVNTYTEPGEWVCDPMAGIGTSLVEAVHAGRNGVGVECEPRWFDLAEANLRHARSLGATGVGEMVLGDARRLAGLVPVALRGRVALVVTSPPYGSYTHGHVRVPGRRRGEVVKVDHLYGGGGANLANGAEPDLVEGLTGVLAGCAVVLRPGGWLAMTTRPYRRAGELVDLPAMAVAAGEAAGLRLVEVCVALIAGTRGGRLVPRASFFQLRNVRDARGRGDPQWAIQHEDVVVLTTGGS